LTSGRRLPNRLYVVGISRSGPNAIRPKGRASSHRPRAMCRCRGRRRRWHHRRRTRSCRCRLDRAARLPLRRRRANRRPYCRSIRRPHRCHGAYSQPPDRRGRSQHRPTRHRRPSLEARWRRSASSGPKAKRSFSFTAWGLGQSSTLTTPTILATTQNNDATLGPLPGASHFQRPSSSTDMMRGLYS